MQLVIVESPTKIKSLTKYLGKDYQVMASMGHIRDLPKSKFGVEIKANGKAGQFEFEPDYGVVKGKGEQVKKLKSAAAKADKVILATDPDREGEAIAFHVKMLLDDKKKDFVRITFHSITQEAILEALKKPGKVDMALVDAQQARRVLDRIVGYKLSPILWRKVRRGLSAGRVQSVALRMVVEREREIEAFKPEEYWEIKSMVRPEGRKPGSENEFWVGLDKIYGKKATVADGKTAKSIIDDLKGAEYKVTGVEKKERAAHPRPPFKTSTLQQAAANVLGWSSKKTMSVAQSLYEQGDITYHRTDSLNLTDIAIKQIRDFIKAEFGDKYLPEKANFYKTSGKVVAQEAHEAVRPTNMEMGVNSFKGQGDMQRDQEKLYSLIWRRTISCQMASAVYHTTKVSVEAEGDKLYQMSVKGEVVKFDGWRRLYAKIEKEEAVLLPEVKKDEKLKLMKVDGQQKFTQPPARFNDASLIKELEKRGIGRPSTYASIVSTLLTRRYVEKKDRRFFPTSVGLAVVDFLVKYFPNEMDYEFTASMEDKLDDVAKGDLEWQKMLSVFYGPFEKKVAEVSDKSERVGVEAEKTGQVCPECKQGEVVIREGRFGKFYSCDRFPDCKYTAKYIEYVEGVRCELCGGRVVVKKTRFGKEFYGCENYPKCKWASWRKPGAKEEEEEGEFE